MMTNDSPNYKDLTTEHLFNLMLDLPQNTEPDCASDKRSCSRWLLRSAAELRFTNADGSEATERVSIQDISMSGVGLICGSRIPEGVPGVLVLRLDDGCYKVDLLAAYCTRTAEGYRVGCRLQLPDAPRLVPMVRRAMLTQEEFEQ
jgi:hypothetical protein